MDKAFKLLILSPLRIEFDGYVNKIISRGKGGEFCILNNHIPYIVALKGVGMTVHSVESGDEGIRIREFYIEGGLMKVDFGRAVVMVEKFREIEKI